MPHRRHPFRDSAQRQQRFPQEKEPGAKEKLPAHQPAFDFLSDAFHGINSNLQYHADHCPRQERSLLLFQKAALSRYIDYSASILHLFCIISASIYKNTRPYWRGPFCFHSSFPSFLAGRPLLQKTFYLIERFSQQFWDKILQTFFLFSHLRRIAQQNMWFIIYFFILCIAAVCDRPRHFFACFCGKFCKKSVAGARMFMLY